jgi:hypothetical protein
MELSKALQDRPELLNVVDLALKHDQLKMVHQIGQQFVPGWDERYELT